MSNHYLVIEEYDFGEPQDSMFEIEHPKECETVDHEGYSSYGCAEGREIDEWGVDDLLKEAGGEGKFPFRYWSHKTPSTPYSPEEYNAGLELL